MKVTNTTKKKIKNSIQQDFEGKTKALQAAFAQIDKQFGAGSVMMLGQRPHTDMPSISTGSLQLDHALGVGGLPRGRIIEIYGPEASGKTTWTLQVIAQAQKKQGTCAFVDAEHAMDPAYAQGVGVNLDELIISQPDYGEQALDIAEVLVRSGAVDVLVIDSVAALVPQAEIEGDMTDIQVGLQARLMSKALRKLTPIVHKSKTVLIFINQIRHKIGGLPFANNETTSGGNALKFYASVRLDVRRIGTLKKNDKPFGNRIAVKVVKNKVAPPFRRIETDLIYGKGVVKELDLLDACLLHKVITKSGSWYNFGQDKIGQGRDSCYKRLASDTDFYEKVYKEVMEKLAHNSGGK